MFRSPARPQPSYGLLTPDRSALSFDGAAWERLQDWIRTVEALPTTHEGALPETEARVAALQRLVASSDAGANLQAPTVEFARRLTGDMANLLELQTSILPPVNGDPGDVRQALRGLGAAAQRIRQRCAPFSASIHDFKDKALFAGQQVAEAHDAEGRRLRGLQEDVGGLRYEVASLERQIDALGVLSRGKKKDLEARMLERRAASTQVVQQAETLRVALKQLDPVVEGRVWLPQALDGLLGFVDSLQRLCTDFGSAMTQRAVDGTEVQFQDADWLREALDIGGKMYPWQALASAARSFIAESSDPSSRPVSNPEVIAS